MKISSSSPNVTAKLEERLWQPFNQIITEEVNGKDPPQATCSARTDSSLEFMPYVFQLLAKLLELNPSGALPNHYQALIAPLMLPTTWETRGNVPALTRLLIAIIPRATQTIVAENQVQPILGIFQGLLRGKKTESNAFDLLETVCLSIPRYVLSEKLFCIC
jgi:exportin-2 (importin alpha re-exporter)